MSSLVIERESKVDKMIERINRSSKLTTPVKNSERCLRTHSVIQNKLEELDIDDRLEDLNRRFERSTLNYESNLKHKVERIKTDRDRRNSMKSRKSLSMDYVDRVMNIKRKLENASMKREKLRKEFNEKVNSKDYIMNEKIERIRRISELELSNKIGKTKDIKEKELKTSEFISVIKRKQRKQVEYRHERHKLLEEDVVNNINRDKRILAMKKERIIEKHLELCNRQKQQHQFLDMVNKKIREKAMNFTKERERLLEIKSKISKSQTPERIRKKFKF